MKIFSYINLLKLLAVLTLLCHILVISMLLSLHVKSLTFFEQVQMLIYILSALFQYVLGWIMIVLLGKTMVSQQFFFIIMLLCTSLLSSTVLLLNNTFVLLSNTLFITLVRIHSFLYISMALFLFLSAINLHYDLRRSNLGLFFIVINISGLLVRLGPAVVTDSTKIAGAFVGGRSLLVGMVISLSVIALFTYLIGISGIRVRRVVTYVQFISLISFIIFLNISLLLIGVPAVIISSNGLSVISLGIYVHGCFSHKL